MKTHVSLKVICSGLLVLLLTAFTFLEPEGETELTSPPQSVPTCAIDTAIMVDSARAWIQNWQNFAGNNGFFQCGSTPSSRYFERNSLENFLSLCPAGDCPFMRVYFGIPDLNNACPGLIMAHVNASCQDTFPTLMGMCLWSGEEFHGEVVSRGIARRYLNNWKGITFTGLEQVDGYTFQRYWIETMLNNFPIPTDTSVQGLCLDFARHTNARATNNVQTLLVRPIGFEMLDGSSEAVDFSMPCPPVCGTADLSSSK